MTRPLVVELVTAWPVFESAAPPHSSYPCLRSLVALLRARGTEVRLISPSPSVYELMTRGERLAAWGLDLVARDPGRAPRGSRENARIAASLERQLAAASGEANVVTVLSCPPPVASMVRVRPRAIFLWDGPDASWHVMTKSAEWKDAAAFAAVRSREEKLFERIGRVVYPVQWSVAAARELYPRCSAEFIVADWGFSRDFPDAASVAVAVDARLARPELRLAMVASDWKRKGGPVAMAAVDLLRAQGRAAELRYFGRAEDALPYSRDGFRYMGFFDHTPESSARFVELLLECHAVLLPSSAEMYPNAIRECARLGVPAVVSDVAGHAEIVADGRTGTVVRSYEPAAYASAIADLAGDRRRLRETSLEASRASSRFNWERVADLVLAAGDQRTSESVLR